MKLIKKVFCILLILSFLFPGISRADSRPFADVPEDHFAYEAICRMKALNITGGVGDNRFGMGQTISRAEFVTFLIKLTGWEQVKPAQGSFRDNNDPGRFYYGYIETALHHGVISKDSDYFRVNDPITREEMAVMIVRALGYDALARQLSFLDSFSDVTTNKGYITLARDFGIMSGTSGQSFSPDKTATREEAAYILMKMYDKLHAKIQELHGFYAISSYSQVDLLSSLDSVSFGWSRLEYDPGSGRVILNTSRQNDNEYGFPQGFSEVLNKAEETGLSAQLMVAVKNETVADPSTGVKVPLTEYILRPEIRSSVIRSIAEQVNADSKDGYPLSFDGVVIDIEGLRANAKEAFNAFLKELRQELDKTGKLLYVAVQPARRPGQAYYDGYDFRVIGDIADKVILMAHDYYARQLTDGEMAAGYTTTPLTPIDEVYYALRAVTDKTTGVQDPGKIMLQISFDAVQWKKKDGVVVNRYPLSVSYETLHKRLLMDDVSIQYSDFSQNPYARFSDAQDGTENIIWYEDARSVEAKMKLAAMFGIRGISLWRLGNIPNYSDGNEKLFLNVWDSVLQFAGRPSK